MLKKNERKNCALKKEKIEVIWRHITLLTVPLRRVRYKLLYIVLHQLIRICRREGMTSIDYSPSVRSSVTTVSLKSLFRSSEHLFTIPAHLHICRPPSRPPSRVATPVQAVPSCRGLYDFVAESSGELSFKEGDTIRYIIYG